MTSCSALPLPAGVPALTAFRMATLNPAEYFRLHDRGAIAPGYRADLMVFSDLQAPVAEMVFRGGKLVAQAGVMLPWDRPARRTVLRSSMNVDWSKVDLSLAVQGSQVRIIGAIPDQLITHHLIEAAPQAEGQVVADTSRDILKMVVIERHLATGRVGKGLIHGLGLQQRGDCQHRRPRPSQHCRDWSRCPEHAYRQPTPWPKRRAGWLPPLVIRCCRNCRYPSLA